MNSNISATGSIRGFDTFDLGQAQTRESVSPSHFSLTDLKERIEKIRNTYDPDFLDSLIVTVLSHIQNENNPHQVTLSEVGTTSEIMNVVYQAWLANGNTGTIQDFYVIFFQVSNTLSVAGNDALSANPDYLITVSGVESLIAAHNADPTAHAELIDLILPGTPPSALPTTAYIAQFGIPLNATTARSTAINALDKNGNLVSVPANTIAIDYSTGVGAFPLYGARTNLIFPSNPTLQPTSNLLNATNSLSPAGTLKVAPDGNVCMVLSDTNTSGIHGYQVGISRVSGNEYTDSVFIYPLSNTGGITLYLDAYPQIAIMVDLSNYTVTTENSNVIGYAQPFPNGWVRIGIQYVASATDTVNLVIAKTPTAVLGSTNLYAGTGALLFGIFGLQHVIGCGMSPYIPTTTATASHDVTSIVITTTIGNTASGILEVSHNHAPSAGAQTRSVIALNNDLLINVVSENIIAKTINIDGSITTLTVADSPNQQTHTAVSYSPNLYKLASTNAPKISQAGTQINLASGQISIILGSTTTPFDGEIFSLALYPVSDTNEELEFLVGQA